MDVNSKQKLDSFFKQYKNQKFKKGEILIQADNEPTGIFYLINGLVRIYTISSSGDELTLNVFKPISFFPMSWAINQTQNHYYYEAMTDVEVLKAPKDAVMKFIKDKPDILLDLLSRIYHGLEGYMMRMEYLLTGNAKAKLISELLIYAKRFGKIVGNQIVIELKITEKDLASQSGIARETVSREIHELKKLDLITFKNNKLIVNDLKKLENELY